MRHYYTTKKSDATIALIETIQKKKCNTKKIETLIEKGADINTLIEKSYYANAFDYNFTKHDTLLTYSIKKDKLKTLKILLDNNVDLYKTNSNDETPLELALNRKSTKVLDLLLEKSPSKVSIDLNHQDSSGKTALMDFLSAHHLAKAEKLIALGAKLNIQDDRAQTALHHAARQLNPEGLELLLKYSAKLNISDTDGYTPLMRASTNGNIVAVKMLLAKKADFNIPSNQGKNPLMQAAAGGHTDIVELLINNQADLDAQDSAGDTALMLAIRSSNADAAIKIIEANANFDLVNNQGQTALAIAQAAEGAESVVEAINYYNDTQLGYYTKGGDEEYSVAPVGDTPPEDTPE